MMMVVVQSKPVVHVSKVVEDEELVRANRMFENAMASQDFKGFCSAKVSSSSCSSSCSSSSHNYTSSYHFYYYLYVKITMPPLLPSPRRRVPTTQRTVKYGR